MMPIPSAEHRPLKRQKLGPPDVYPQEPKQREDELDEVSVRHGFTHRPQIQDEYGSALHSSFTSPKIASNFNAILKKKAEHNQLPDTGRKKQQINIKDNFWVVIPRAKSSSLEAWLKDLAGSKPLTSLAKKVPIFPKWEDMLLTLCSYQVPMFRATWYIKMASFYHETKMAESKNKRKPQIDLYQDWTQTLTRFLKEYLSKIAEIYMGTGPGISSQSITGANAGPTSISSAGLIGSSSGVSQGSTSISGAQSSPHHGMNQPAALQSSQLPELLRNWNYCCQLALFMYQDGLLDRQDFLEWLIDSMVRLRHPDQDCILRVLLPLALQYLDQLTQSQFLSRKLAYYSANKIRQLCFQEDLQNNSSQSQIPSGNQNTLSTTSISCDTTPNSCNTQSNGSIGNSSSNQSNSTTVQEMLGCHQHRSILLSLSCFLQAITLDCPTALVWNNICYEIKSPQWLVGSPLDLLPCAPSDLPMPSRSKNYQIRIQLKIMEDHIRQRSKAAENRWSLDRTSVNINGSTITRVLSALDALDTHCFSRVDATNSLDTLYNKIFSSIRDSNGENASSNVKSLCASAGSSPGPNQMNSNPQSGYSQQTTPSEDAVIRTLCEWAVSVQRSGAYRSLVVARLLEKRQNDLTTDSGDLNHENGGLVGESEANEEKDIDSSGSSYVFQDLLLKFLDKQAPVYDENTLSAHSQEFGNLILLFSELIRQDVFSHDAYMCTLISRGDLAQANSFKQVAADNVDNIDDDLDKIIQNITKEADAPDSPKDDVNTSLEEQGGGDSSQRGSGSKHRPPRHLIYAQHFPLPSDEAYNHEINQRYVLLYGVGKARDEARHAVKKLSKEILKLFSKKFSIDIADGGKVKRSSRGEINFETILNRFKSLSYFDQHVITNQISSQVLEMLSGCGSGLSNYLPLLEHISFLMDLMEVCLNIQGLLDLCMQIIKEIVDIEAQLVERGCQVGIYCPQLTLHVVGVLRKQHCCLLVSQEQTTAIFECLCRLVKHVTNPSDCTSPERVVLAHLHDLYTICSFLKSKHHESFSNAYPKIKQTLYACIAPAKGSFRWVPSFMEDYIKNPKLKVEQCIIKQLNEPANRYSFVWSAIIEACSAVSNEKLNDLAILCAELTACCNALSAEWLRVLSTLCCSSESYPGYNDVLSHIDLGDPRYSPTIHSSLSVFTAILIARHCFTLLNFLNHVVFQSLKAAWNNGNGNPEAEPGARLTCHLLLRIFKVVESPQLSQYSAVSPPNVATSISQRSIRMSCDRNLLAAAAHTSLTMAPVLAVLKAMLLVSDAMSGQRKSQASISDILGTSDAGNGSNDSSDMMGKGADKACLADFARYALRQICSQEWVRETCLKCPKDLCTPENLLDRMVLPKQALHLLHLICYPDSPNSQNEASLDQHSILSTIFEDLDIWTLRISWLDLKLMYAQHKSSTSSSIAQSQIELNSWLDNVAQAVIRVFQQDKEPDSKHRANKPRSISLIAPLISKLPRQIQEKVLCVAGEFLNAVNFGSFAPHSSIVQTQNTRLSAASNILQNQQQVPSPPREPTPPWPVSSHRPFLQLVLMCLEGEEDQLVGLLESLKEQLTQAVNLYKEDKNHQLDDSENRQQVLDALRLRFALVGSLFDKIVISFSSSLICEWAQLLVNLMLHGVIDLTNNSELFTNVLDMLCALIHSTLTIETNSESREENRRNYSIICKKVKKELLDHNNVSLRLVRQLIPFPKVHAEILALEPWGTISDNKGNRMQDYENEKKHGLQVCEKQRISPWDLLDGHRNPAPLSWVSYAATKLERKPIKYEENHRLQMFHTHSLIKPSSYYLEPPPLPAEDLEPVPDKVMIGSELLPKEEVKAPLTPSDQSPRGSKRGGSRPKGRGRNPRPRQPSVTPMNNAPMQAMPYQQSSSFNSPNQPQWGSGAFNSTHQNSQTNQTQQSPYQQLPPVGGPQFGGSTVPSRVAIQNVLLHRQPGPMMNQNSSGNFPSMTPMNQMGRSVQMIRGQMRHQGPMYAGMGSMQGGMAQPMTNQGSQMYPVSQGGPGVPTRSQYSNFQQGSIQGGQMNSGGPLMSGGATGPSGGPIMAGYQAGYQGPTPSMMTMRQQQSYMSQGMGQGQMVQRPPYQTISNPNMQMMGSGQTGYRAPMQTMGQNPASMMRSSMMMSGSSQNPTGRPMMGQSGPSGQMMAQSGSGGPMMGQGNTSGQIIGQTGSSATMMGQSGNSGGSVLNQGGKTGSMVGRMQRHGNVGQQAQQQQVVQQQTQQQQMMQSAQPGRPYQQPPPY